MRAGYGGRILWVMRAGTCGACCMSQGAHWRAGPCKGAPRATDQRCATRTAHASAPLHPPTWWPTAVAAEDSASPVLWASSLVPSLTWGAGREWTEQTQWVRMQRAPLGGPPKRQWAGTLRHPATRPTGPRTPFPPPARGAPRPAQSQTPPAPPPPGAAAEGACNRWQLAARSQHRHIVAGQAKA